MKTVIWYLVIIITSNLAGAIILTLADYTLMMLNLAEFPPILFFNRVAAYSLFAITAYVVGLVFLPTMSWELLYRFYQFSFRYYLLGSMVIFGFYVYAFWEDPMGLVDVETPVQRIKNSICLLLTGFAYPFITEYWSRRFKIYLRPA